MTCWVTLGDTLSNAHALVDTLSDTVPKMEELSVGDTHVGAQALVDARADTLTEVEALTTGDTVRHVQALNDLQGDTWRDIRQCAATCRHAFRHGTRDGGVVSRRHMGLCGGTEGRLG